MKKRAFDKKFYFVSSRTLLYDLKWIVLSLITNVYSAVLQVFVSKNGEGRSHEVAICAIFKNEGVILHEWLSYHLSIGVDHIYLYNNFSTDNYLEILKPYINDGVVTLIDWPYERGQMTAYSHCYDNYGNDCKWLGFIDLDEFVVPISKNSIKEFLSQYKSYPAIMMYWKMFGTSGLLEHDKGKLHIEEFFMSWDIFYEYGKTFYNMDYKLPNIHMNLCQHYSTSRIKIFGFNLPAFPINDSGFYLLPYYLRFGAKRTRAIQLNHYWSKSYNSYGLKNKKGRSGSSSNFITNDMFYRCEYFNTTADYSIRRFVIQTKLTMDKYTNEAQ